MPYGVHANNLEMPNSSEFNEPTRSLHAPIQLLRRNISLPGAGTTCEPVREVFIHSQSANFTVKRSIMTVKLTALVIFVEYDSHTTILNKIAL